jgi:hypothetical protein
MACLLAGTSIPSTSAVWRLAGRLPSRLLQNTGYQRELLAAIYETTIWSFLHYKCLGRICKNFCTRVDLEMKFDAARGALR